MKHKGVNRSHGQANTYCVITAVFTSLTSLNDAAPDVLADTNTATD